DLGCDLPAANPFLPPGVAAWRSWRETGGAHQAPKLPVGSLTWEIEDLVQRALPTDPGPGTWTSGADLRASFRAIQTDQLVSCSQALHPPGRQPNHRLRLQTVLVAVPAQGH
ncbi:hypothetical protein ATANTOWER_026606, partial [Ataeniobius toweri]|nr:hypothetical protein [Ataeniobius toweri]